MKKRNKNTTTKKSNPVAKFARFFAHAVTMRDRSKYSRNDKHKGQAED